MLSIQMLMERQVHFLPFFYYPPFFTENELITLSTLPAKAVYLHLSRNGSLLAHHYSGLLSVCLSNPYEHTENFSSIVNLQMLREKYGMLMDRQAENVYCNSFFWHWKAQWSGPYCVPACKIHPFSMKYHIQIFKHFYSSKVILLMIPSLLASP